MFSKKERDLLKSVINPDKSYRCVLLHRIKKKVKLMESDIELYHTLNQQKPIAPIKAETVKEIESTSEDCKHFTPVSRFCSKTRDTCTLISKNDRLNCPKRKD